MKDIEQIITRQEESFRKFKHYLAETYPLQHITPHPQYDIDVFNWHRSSIKEILEGVVEFEKKELRNNHKQQDEPAEAFGYREAKFDTINHLDSIINKLK